MGSRIDVLLDLDGTLIDPKPGILGSIRYALERMGHPEPPPFEELHWAIGPPLRSTFTRLLGEAQAEAAVTHYRDNYRNGAMYDCEVYAGIPELLAALAGQGHRLFIVTAKPQVFAEPIAERVGLAAHMSGIYGPDLDGTLDDKRDLLAHVLRRESIPPEQAVMIGDRKFDILAARANSVSGIGITWGYGTPEELREAGSHALCDTTEQLGQAIADLDAAPPKS